MRKSKEKYFLYIGFCLAILPIILLRDFSPANELRYLSIADEALRNHTFFTFYSHGMPYADKPPLYLWIVMLLRYTLGSHQMWALSLASVIPALITVRVMDAWTKDDMDADSRSVARMMLLTSGLFTGLAVTLRMDMLMCMFIVLAMHSFWHIYINGKSVKQTKWLFPTYLFLAIFTKGPLGLLIPLSSITVFLCMRKQWRYMSVVYGWRTWAVLLIGCSLWFSIVYIEGGNEYLYNLLFHQTVDRAINSFHHSRPFYFYFECIWYCLAPWSLLVIGSVVAALKRNTVKSSLHKFFITSSLTTVLLLSCISGKLQVYMLPAIPFLIYATAIYMPRAVDKKWSVMAVAVPGVLLLFSLPLLYLASRFYNVQWLKNPLLYIAAFVLTTSGIRSLYLLIKKENDFMEEAVRNIGAGILVSAYIAAFSLPCLNRYIGYGNLCEKANILAKQNGINKFASWNMSHASDMDVYLKAPVHVIPDEVDPKRGIRQSTILFIPLKYKKMFEHNETHIVGDYALVVINRKK